MISCGQLDVNSITRKHIRHLTIIHDLDGVLHHNSVSAFMEYYAKEIELRYKLFIPQHVTIVLQRFVGLLFYTKLIDSKRAGHDSVIIYVKNKPYLFIFGGYDIALRSLNDSVIQPL